jgi:hypothetical protein
MRKRAEVDSVDELTRSSGCERIHTYLSILFILLFIPVGKIRPALHYLHQKQF